MCSARMLAPALVPPTGTPSALRSRISLRRGGATEDGGQAQLVAAGDEHPGALAQDLEASSLPPSARLSKSSVSTRPPRADRTIPHSVRRYRPACWRWGSPRCRASRPPHKFDEALEDARRFSLSSAPPMGTIQPRVSPSATLLGHHATAHSPDVFSVRTYHAAPARPPAHARPPARTRSARPAASSATRSASRRPRSGPCRPAAAARPRCW
jgi:hypothetical protein